MKTCIINNLEFAQTQQKLVENFAAFDCKRLAEIKAKILSLPPFILNLLAIANGFVSPACICISEPNYQ
jgi:hypothetical protein